MIWVEEKVRIEYLVNLIFITGVERMEEWKTNGYIGSKYERKL